MFKCNECGAVFEYDDLIEIVETHGLDNPPYERFLVCPNCNGGDYDEYREEDEE